LKSNNSSFFFIKLLFLVLLARVSFPPFFFSFLLYFLHYNFFELVLSSNSIFFFSCFCFSFLAFNFYNRNNNHNNNASSLSQFVFNPIIFKKILREILCCSPSPLTIRLTSVSLFLPSYPVHRNLSIHHITFHTNIHPSFIHFHSLQLSRLKLTDLYDKLIIYYYKFLLNHFLAIYNTFRPYRDIFLE